MVLTQITSTLAADFRKIDGASRARDEKTDNFAVRSKAADRTSLSSEAREAGANAAAMRVLAQRVEAQPDVRQDRIEATRQRVESGFYNSEEFASNLADRLISEFGR
ncbi:MAG: flagellar biosynthesis anti-sigma factor FlgM [Chitinivibrionia bacterium]|nr:flagellar biosynthesis anti-sigma factor FlgM [Chitinivibrionia bacterium]